MLRIIAALAAAMALLTGPAFASGLWPGLPNSTSPGATSTGGSSTGGGPITAGSCIPMDTGNASGINPATQCVTPSQLSNYSSGVKLSYSTISVPNTVSLTNTGTDTTPVAGTIYSAQINIPVAFTITNVACLNGSAASTDTLIYGVYDANGTLVKSTSLSGVTASGTNAFQQIALTAPYSAAAGTYFIGYQASGTTTRFHTISANGAGLAVSSQTGVAGTMATLSPVPSTFTAGVGPICYVN